MNAMKSLIIQAAALLLITMAHFECGSKKPLAADGIPPDTTITLTRTGCYGTCPIYDLKISFDGTVTFEGRNFVKTKGAATGKISQEQLKQLISEFEKADYFSLKDKYEHDCPSVSTDSPSAYTSIKIGGKSKSISHYHGCTGLKELEALTRLEDRIDEIAGSSQWIR